MKGRRKEAGERRKVGWKEEGERREG